MANSTGKNFSFTEPRIRQSIKSTCIPSTLVLALFLHQHPHDHCRIRLTAPAAAVILPMSIAKDPSAFGTAALPLPTAWNSATPHSHLVQFYEDDAFLIDSLGQWFSE